MGDEFCIAACVATSHCRWLMPGCGSAPAVSEGCYLAVDCDAVDCGLDKSCQPVSIDSCWDSQCRSCGGEARVCL